MTTPNANRLLAESWLAAVECHAELTSTNDRARQLAGEPGVKWPALIVADRQTAGRGRGSNRWWTGENSLAFSLLLDPAARGIERRNSPLLSLAAATAIVETVRPHLASGDFGTGHALGLHWPNDVFADGRKLAGVLVEALPTGQHIVGIGLNTNNSLADAPDELRATVATLADLAGRHFDHTDLLLALLAEFDRELDTLAADPAALGERCNTICLQHGQTLTIQSGDRRVSGNCAGIAPDGALLLDTPTGCQRYYGGFLVRT